MSDRGFLAELAGLDRHSRLLWRLGSALGRGRRGPPPAPDPDSLCGELARHYRNLALSAEAVGNQFGFPTLFMWQPLRATTSKRLTDWEKSLLGWGGGGVAGTEAYRNLVRRCTTSVDSLMQDRAGRMYFPLHTLFDSETSSVHLDDYGHLTEAANAVVADRIVELVVPLLEVKRVPQP
jgi:hypothetical protein